MSFPDAQWNVGNPIPWRFAAILGMIVLSSRPSNESFERLIAACQAADNLAAPR
jgi:hypothetical protein